MANSERPVVFTPSAARRIARAVQSYEHGDRSSPATRLPRSVDDGSPVRVGKTVSAWNKGTLATIELYEDGTPPDETAPSSPPTLADCVNKFADVDADSWVIVAQAANGYYYLIAAECGGGSGSS